MSSQEFRGLLSNRAIAGGLSIDRVLIDRLAAYFTLLAHWNARINLTGFSLERPTAQAVDRLFIEPLLVAQTFRYPLDTWLDLGSGAGSPAIPIQVCRPANLLVLVESRAKKAAFLREVCRELSLANVEVAVIRIESITSSHRLAGRADLVTVRAVRPSEPIWKAIRSLLRTGGQAALIGSTAQGLVLPAGFQIAPIIELASIDSLLMLSKA